MIVIASCPCHNERTIQYSGTEWIKIAMWFMRWNVIDWIDDHADKSVIFR